MGLGADAGLNAAKEAHRALDDAIPAAQKVLDEVISRTASEIVTQATGAVTQAFGSLEIALGSFPEALTTALDGLTVKFEGKITVQRKDS